MFFSVLTTEFQIPGHSCHPPKSRSWPRGGPPHLAAPSGPGSQTLSSCHRWGAWRPGPNWPSVPQAPKRGQEAGPTACSSGQWLPLFAHRDRGCRVFPSTSRPRLLGGRGEGSGASDTTLASSLGAQLTRWFWARERAGGPWAEASVRSSLTSPHGHAPLLADPAPRRGFLTGGPLWAGRPTLAPTNGSVGPVAR